MDASSPPAPPYRHFSLLTGPWHTSSRVVAGVVLLFLVFCNVPGQLVTRVRLDYGWQYIWSVMPERFATESRFEHGWPWTYLSRRIFDQDLYAPDRSALTCFEFTRYDVEFSLGILLVNVFAIVLTSWGCGIGFEAWRRGRKRVWQLHLRDLFGGMVVISIIGAWYVYQQRRFAAQQAAITQSTNENFVSEYQDGGITWLRFLLGDERFQFLDRAFVVRIRKSEDWQHLDALATAERVDAYVRATTSELSQLRRFPRLVALSLDDFDDPRGYEPVIVDAELPQLPTVQGLELGCRYRRIDHLPSLEVIYIHYADIDDETLAEIGRLSKLQELHIDKSPVTVAGLAELSSVPQLCALELEQIALNGESMESLGRLRQLTSLQFKQCEFDDRKFQDLSTLGNLESLSVVDCKSTSPDWSSLAALKGLRYLALDKTPVGGNLRFLSTLHNLESLSLDHTTVTGDDLAPLIGLKQLRQLFLAYTPVGNDAAIYLRQMKQLEWLVLRGARFSEAEKQALEAALPDCEINF